ncbi:hypothetical protein IAR50_007076 [Cryptococcus sp. DSM 104548]
MYDVTKDQIKNLYGDIIQTVNQDAITAMRFAVSQIAEEGLEEEPAYTAAEVEQIVTRLSQAHVVSVIKSQLDKDEWITSLTSVELGIGVADTQIDADAARQDRATLLSEESKVNMDRTISLGSTTIVWDDKGCRMTLKTGGLLEPVISDVETNVPAELRQGDSRKSWVVMNNKGVVSFSDANGVTFSFGYD